MGNKDDFSENQCSVWKKYINQVNEFTTFELGILLALLFTTWSTRPGV